MRILVAEDERDLNRLICDTLKADGCSADGCHNGEEALEFLAGAEYDAVILDIMMPVMNGHEVVRTMRSRGDATPVLFLTARDSVEDRVEGLDLGADDYLVKPFAFSELLARVRAITRKYSRSRSAVCTVGDLSLNTVSREVTRGGSVIALSAKEYSILEFMVRNKGMVLSRERIENNAWSFDYAGGSNVVDVYISYLRKKIDGGRARKLIHTVWGSGWVIREPE